MAVLGWKFAFLAMAGVGHEGGKVLARSEVFQRSRQSTSGLSRDPYPSQKRSWEGSVR
jgi:hypothetical protein